MSYTPKPIDVTRVKLPPQLDALAERLAENVHDLWAQQRMKDGWRVGEKRDDAAKTHPGLVPYSELSETEKEYDRITAGGVLKSIVALGYQIEPPNKPES